MLSLFENNRNLKDITVYLLGTDISEHNKDTLYSIAHGYNRDCQIIEMPNIDIPKSLITARWPQSAFNRLYAANILPDTIDKVLYLDCDTLILGQLSELSEMDLEEYFIYGVKDCIGASYKKNVGLSREKPYINAGVLYLNLHKLRKVDISHKIKKFLERFGKRIHYADQDLLNGMFNGEFGVLPAEYDVMTLEYMYCYHDILKLRHPVNYYSKKEIEYAVSNPKIVHFTTCMLNIRPWYESSNHPLTAEFLKYKNMSPWKENALLVETKKKSSKVNTLKMLQNLPHGIETTLLGLIHSIFYPKAIWIKAILKR